MTPCEHSPCDAHTAFEKAVKWVIGVLIVVGGVGIGFAVDQARDAKSEARTAKEKASNIAVLENDMSHLREEMKLVNIKLESINDIKVTMATMAGDMRLTLEKVNQLERGE